MSQILVARGEGCWLAQARVALGFRSSPSLDKLLDVAALARRDQPRLLCYNRLDPISGRPQLKD